MKKNYNNQKNSSFILSFIAIFLVVVAFGGIFMNFSNIKDIFKKLSEDELPVETPVEDSTDDNDELVKQLYCQYLNPRKMYCVFSVFKILLKEI